MAYDKVIDSSGLDGALTATANAIRAKTGKTSVINWSESHGFANAVNQIDALTEPICEFRIPAQQDYPDAMILHGYKEISENFSDNISNSLKYTRIKRIDFSGSPNCAVIRAGAFHEFEACEELHLPENISRIESDAFSSFDALETLVLPENVQKIEEAAFETMIGLKNIEVRCNFFDAGSAFMTCPSIEKVWISRNCQTIIGYPFWYLSPNITIYAEATRRPSDWREGFDLTMSGQVTVIYGQERPW